MGTLAVSTDQGKETATSTYGVARCLGCSYLQFHQLRNEVALHLVSPGCRSMDGARVQDSGFPADLGQPGDLQCSASGFDYPGFGLGLGFFESWDACAVGDP